MVSSKCWFTWNFTHSYQFKWTVRVQSPPLRWRWRFQCDERRNVLQPLDLLIGWSNTIVNLTIQTLRSAKHRQTTEQSLWKFLQSQHPARVKDMLSQRKLKDSFLASLKRFLGTSGGITHYPPTLSIRVTFQAHPRWTRNSLLVYLCMNPKCQETRGYLNYTNSMGGQSQA